MKKEEIEHLKEDEFVTFVEKVLRKIEENKKQVIAGLVVILSLVALLILILFIKNKAIDKDNDIFHKAMVIHNSEKLTLNRKIEKLEELKAKNGLSATVNIYLASCHYQQGEILKAQDLIKNSSAGRFKVAKEQKEILSAEILITQNKKQQAQDLLNRLLSDSKSKISKDFLLYKIAEIQKDLKQFDKVKETVGRLSEAYPQSVFNRKAQELL